MDSGQKRYARYLLMVVLFTLFLLNGCGSDARQNNSVEIPERQSSQAALSAQQIPPVSPTPIRPVAGPAVLGGQIGTFVKKFGDPNSHSDPSFDSYSFRRYSTSNVDYLRVVGDTGDGQQWTPYVYLIVASAPPHQPWDSTSAEAICSSFLPMDAKYVSQLLDIGKQGVTQGVNILFFSAALKATLPATQFNNAQHNPVQPGLLDIYYSFVNGNQNIIDGCTLAPGRLAS